MQLNGLVQEVTFSGKICFSSKVPQFLHVLFDEVVKHSPCIFLAGLHLVSENREDKISKHAQWTQQSWTRAFKPQKDTGECFSTKLKGTRKNSGTFEGKEILPEKVTYVPLAPSHSMYYSDFIFQRNKRFLLFFIQQRSPEHATGKMCFLHR